MAEDETEGEEDAGPTPYQLRIFNFLREHSWTETVAEFELSSKRVVSVIAMRTALGLKWHRGHLGGARPYLNGAYMARLVHLIDLYTSEHRSIRTCELLSLAQTLREEMMSQAYRELLIRGCPQLAKEISGDISPPSRPWINCLCAKNNIRIVEGREMEGVRCMACERSRIIGYFLKHLPTFNRDSRLVFGADETDMKAGSTFKVVTDGIQSGFTEADEQRGHLTAMCCHNAAGASVPPMILLPAINALPEDLSAPSISADNVAWFCTTKSGWMTEASFYMWCLCFCHWLSQYRATQLPPAMSQSEVLLILDGHASRRCPEALKLLKFHKVDVLCLPGHCTHLLQPFDVTIASSLKTYFRRFLLEEKRKQKEQEGTRRWSQYRRAMVTAFIRAWKAASSPEMCARSFEVAGIIPSNPFRVLESPFVVTSANYVEEATLINNEIITGDNIIAELERTKKRSAMMTPDYRNNPDFLSLVYWMRNNDIISGRLLSGPPSLFDFDEYGRGHLKLSFDRACFTPQHPSRVMKMMKRLADMETQRGSKLIETVTQEFNTGARKVIEEKELRSISLRLAQGLSQELEKERVKQFLEMISRTLQCRMFETIQRGLQGLEEEHKPVTDRLAREIQDVVTHAICDVEQTAVDYPEIAAR